MAAAVLLAQQLRQAAAQGVSRRSSGVDTDSALRMRDAAAAFIESLGEAERKAVRFPLDADQRTSWSNLPVAIVPRVGINVGALGIESKRRFHDLLRASTSSQGYHKIAEIMRHDDILRVEELEYLKDHPPRPRAGRNAIESMGSANYWIAIFGEPMGGKAWAWLLTGHHLGATFTCADGRVTAAPLFLGAQPLEDLKGPYAGFVVLSHEGLRGLDLVNSLHPEQAKVAVVSTEPFFSDVLTGVGRRNSLSRFEACLRASSTHRKSDCCWRWSTSTCATRTSTRPNGTSTPFNALASISCIFRGAVRPTTFAAPSTIGFMARG
jgi:hypothetical protein